MKFKIKIGPEASDDIQQGIDWYNKKQKGLGRKFYKEVNQHFQTLKINPFFQVRYKNVRCLPLQKYPYMVHFTLNEEEKTVSVLAVINTSQHPDVWPNP